MIEYNEEYDALLNLLINNFPKNYIGMIKSSGFKNRYENRSYLLDYINSCTPLLQDPIYNLKTKVYWVINHIEDWNNPLVRCKNQMCEVENGKPFVGMNIKKLKDGYVKCCCKKCEREVALRSCVKHMQEKYGVDNAFLLSSVIQNNKDHYNEISKKSILTKKKHGTLKTSEPENEIYRLLQLKFNDIKRQYKSPEYPFLCDFYIPSQNLYIEYNGSWTHNNHLFDPTNENDIKTLELWKEKAKTSNFYINAIDTWTKRDVEKNKIAKKNNLNYIVFWTIDEVITWLNIKYNVDKYDMLIIPWDKSKAKYEYNYFLTHNPDKIQEKASNYNYIIKYFQQDTFYKKEKELWQDPSIRQKLISNRKHYLKKSEDELNVFDILSGFKISGIHYGYSHFNPMWFKWFINKYDVKSCYDPCGGWGHRLLGSSSLEQYIYNDLSKSTKENVDRMIDYFKINNTITYNNDAKTFIPNEDFDAMFTCPPYFNLEHYECGDFKDLNEYKKLIDSIFNVFNKKTTCKLFGLVTREDMLFSHIDYVEKFEIMLEKVSYLSNKLKKLKEFLYIYNK